MSESGALKTELRKKNLLVFTMSFASQQFYLHFGDEEIKLKSESYIGSPDI